MGGLFGHMQHVYENTNLTFRDLFDIIKKLSTNSLNATEKTDGINLFLSFCCKTNTLRFARNKTDIRQNGRCKEDVLYVFKSPELASNIFQLLERLEQKILILLSKKERLYFFQKDGTLKYYNAEVLLTSASNVFKYTLDSVLLHYKNDDAEDKHRVVTLAKKIKIFSDPEIKTYYNEYQGYIDAFNDILNQHNLTENSKIKDFLVDCLSQKIENEFAELTQESKFLLISRMLSEPGVSATKVYKSIKDKTLKAKTRSFIKNQKEIIRECRLPIEEILHSFSVNLLENISSKFIVNKNTEKKRIALLLTEIDHLAETKGNSYCKKEMIKHKKRLFDVGNGKLPSIEGIVFTYKNETYKMTGNFAPINQIFGLYNFGRGNKSAPLKECYDEKNSISSRII